MLLFLHTTGACDLRCAYCGGSFSPQVVPHEVRYRISDLQRFVDGCEDLTIAFYGGEPLLRPRFIAEVMDSIHADRYVIQTNGLNVRRLPQRYWRRFDAVLVSIDGVREVTDAYRGTGVYDAVLRSVRWLRDVGFSGDLIARMTVSEMGDIHRDVMHLLSLNLFNHVHWQLDVVWSDRWDDFDGWAMRSYLPGVRRLVRWWIREMRKGRVPGVVPFLGLVKAALATDQESPPCGAGRTSFAISTDGRVLACPIAVTEEWAHLGNVRNSHVEDCINAVSIGEPCISCDVFRFCGGRCLYAYKERLWGDDGFGRVCNVTKRFIGEVLSTLPEIECLLEAGKIAREDVLYPQFNNSTEIIP